MIEESVLDYINRLIRFLRNAFRRKNKDFDRSYYRAKYGHYKGHFAWDLAVDWMKMGPDKFYEAYQFDFKPDGDLFE